MDGPGELLGTVRLVKHIVSQGLQVSEVSAARAGQRLTSINVKFIVLT